MGHPRDSLFEDHVIGALGESEGAAFVAHVSRCEACAAKLQAAAKVELAILEIHAAKRATSNGPPTHSAGRRALAAGAAVLAVVAATVMLARSPADEAGDVAPMSMKASAPRAATPIPPAVCPDGVEQEKCIEEAHRHGRSVSYPPWAKAPPLGGGPSSRGPNGSPFAPPAM